jgi:uncharacterized membrane protein
MLRSAAALCLILGLAACGESPMGQAEGPAAPPADAPASAPVGPDFSGDFDLVGTEPFWGVRVRPDGLVVSRPDRPDQRFANGGPVVAGEVATWTAQALRIDLRPEACSDGMSDRVYGYAARVEIDGVAFRGCGARPRQPGAPGG